MDLYKNMDRIRIMLLQTCGCSEEEAIVVCQSLIHILKEKIKQDEAQKKLNENLKQIQVADIRENRRVNGYKITRFKKPLPPVEERRVYQRVCRRCNKLYRTTSKYSWFCDKCKLKGQGNQIYEKNKYHQK